MNDHVYVATKKQGQREKRKVAFEQHDDACEWVEDQIRRDPHVDDYETVTYKRLVYQNGDGLVVGHVEEVPSIEKHRADQPAILTGVQG